MMISLRLLIPVSLCAFLLNPALSFAQQEPGVPSPLSSPSFLEQDARLEVKLDVHSSPLTGAGIFARIKRTTGIKIQTNPMSLECEKATLTVACKAISARALMDAFAAFYQASWVKIEPSKYLLVLGKQSYETAYNSRGKFAQERYAAGRQFVQSLGALPEKERARILSPQGLPFRELPSLMQRQVGQMAEALRQETVEKGQDIGLPLDRLAETSFQLEQEPTSEFNVFFATINLSGAGSWGWRFDDYENWKRQQNEKRRKRQEVPGGVDDTYETRKFEISQKEARQLPALRRTVEIHVKHRTLVDVLQSLHEKYGIPVLTDTRRTMPQRANVDLGPMPLSEALDRLTEIYQDTEWEYRKRGFFDKAAFRL